MRTLFLTFIALIILITYIAYSMFTTYGTMMSVIINPIACPETHCVVCPEIIHTPIDESFSFQKCNYEIMCKEFGYCEACPKSWEIELQECQKELENLDKYIK